MRTKEEWDEISERLRKFDLESIEKVSEAFMMLGKASKVGAKELNRLRETLEPDNKIMGNKRNGTQDRQQAFGNLF